MKENRGENMDFKIGDEIEEVDESSEGNQSSGNKIGVIVVVIIALIVGLGVFFVSYHFLGPKKEKEEPVTATPLSLTEDNVQILYAYVTYGTLNQRNDKFIKEGKVTMESFSNVEKFYYALQFAQVEDFVFSNRYNDHNQKIYIISNAKIKSYMERFFGTQVTYTTNNVITYPFSFRINGQNVGIMTYSSSSSGFETVFDGFEEDVVSTALVEPYYTKLDHAEKEIDGSYVLYEKIIYTNVEQADGIYTVHVYKDHGHAMEIETKPNQTEEMLKNNPIDIKNYENKASTIKYTFKLHGTTLCFESSEIIYS